MVRLEDCYFSVYSVRLYTHERWESFGCSLQRLQCPWCTMQSLVLFDFSPSLIFNKIGKLSAKCEQSMRIKPGTRRFRASNTNGTKILTPEGSFLSMNLFLSLKLHTSEQSSSRQRKTLPFKKDRRNFDRVTWCKKLLEGTVKAVWTQNLSAQVEMNRVTNKSNKCFFCNFGLSHEF